MNAIPFTREQRSAPKGLARAAVEAGAALAAVWVACVGVGYFADLGERNVGWVILAGFAASAAICCVGGARAERRTGSRAAGALAGAIAATLAGLVVPLAIYALPYWLPDLVKQNPFDNGGHDGEDARAFLLSADGRAFMRSYVSLVPDPLLSAVGGFFGFLGAIYSAASFTKGEPSR